MKTSAIISVLALALTAAAAPGNKRWSSGGGSGGSCDSSQAQVCCDGILTCVVNVLGSDCSGTAYCCTTSSPVGTLVSINALDCVAL